MNDNEIVEAVPYLNRYALVLTRNKSDADDLVSMTVVKAIEMVRFHNAHIDKPKPYLARVMYNTYVSQFCRKRSMEALEDYTVSVSPRQENVVMLSEVMAKMDRLPYTDKRVMQATMDGMTVDEISRKMRGYRTGKSTIRKTIENFKRTA